MPTMAVAIDLGIVVRAVVDRRANARRIVWLTIKVIGQGSFVEQDVRSVQIAGLIAGTDTLIGADKAPGNSGARRGVLGTFGESFG